MSNRVHYLRVIFSYPLQVATKVKGEVAMTMISKEETELNEQEEDEEEADVPGSCFVTLLQMTPQQARIGKLLSKDK